MQTQWINIKKQLPEPAQQVLLWYNLNSNGNTPIYKCAVASMLDNKKKFIYLDGVIDIHNVMGWLSIPEFKLN